MPHIAWGQKDMTVHDPNNTFNIYGEMKVFVILFKLLHHSHIILFWWKHFHKMFIYAYLQAELFLVFLGQITFQVFQSDSQLRSNCWTRFSLFSMHTHDHISDWFILLTLLFAGQRKVYIHTTLDFRPYNAFLYAFCPILSV